MKVDGTAQWRSISFMTTVKINTVVVLEWHPWNNATTKAFRANGQSIDRLASLASTYFRAPCCFGVRVLQCANVVPRLDVPDDVRSLQTFHSNSWYVDQLRYVACKLTYNGSFPWATSNFISYTEEYIVAQMLASQTSHSCCWNLGDVFSAWDESVGLQQ